MSRKIQEVKDGLALEKQIKQSLIDQANATTGKEDTDLTSAVGSLVSGFGQGGSEDSLADDIIARTTTNVTIDATKIGNYVFYKHTTLESITGNNVESLGAEVFNNCTKLTEVNFPNLQAVGGGRIFTGCKSLESISFPNLVKMYTTETPTAQSTYMFDACTALKNVNLPKLEAILSSSMFRGCTSLEKILLPSVCAFQVATFQNCTNLTTLILPYETAVVTLSNTNSFTNTPIESGTGYIYVPKALIEDYKVATNWATFADQFRAIEDYPEICGGVTE